MEAGSQSAVIERLHELGHLPIRAEERSEARPAGWLRRNLFADRRVPTKDIGLVTRERDRRDRRGRLAVLTPAGRGRLRQATPVVAAGITQRFTGPLGADGNAAVSRACDRILASRPAR